MEDSLSRMRKALLWHQSKIASGEATEGSLAICFRGNPGKLVSFKEMIEHLQQQIAELEKEQSLQQPEKH